MVLQYRYKKEFAEQIEEVNFDDLQKEYGSKNSGFEMKPNVIVIMNEAFSDLREYSGVCVRAVRSEGNRRIID